MANPKYKNYLIVLLGLTTIASGVFAWSQYQELVKLRADSLSDSARADLTGWQHAPRAFAGAKDKGLIICTWPKGGRPGNVMLYSDEVWTGIEYQVAAHMIYEGLVEEGFAIVKAARDRYDLHPLVIHVNYLINLASLDAVMVQ